LETEQEEALFFGDWRTNEETTVLNIPPDIAPYAL
jgi:hypothetical protein